MVVSDQILVRMISWPPSFKSCSKVPLDTLSMMNQPVFVFFKSLNEKNWREVICSINFSSCIMTWYILYWKNKGLFHFPWCFIYYRQKKFKQKRKQTFYIFEMLLRSFMFHQHFHLQWNIVDSEHASKTYKLTVKKNIVF